MISEEDNAHPVALAFLITHGQNLAARRFSVSSQDRAPDVRQHQSIQFHHQSIQFHHQSIQFHHQSIQFHHQSTRAPPTSVFFCIQVLNHARPVVGTPEIKPLLTISPRLQVARVLPHMAHACRLLPAALHRTTDLETMVEMVGIGSNKIITAQAMVGYAILIHTLVLFGINTASATARITISSSNVSVNQHRLALPRQSVLNRRLALPRQSVLLRRLTLPRQSVLLRRAQSAEPFLHAAELAIWTSKKAGNASEHGRVRSLCREAK